MRGSRLPRRKGPPLPRVQLSDLGRHLRRWETRGVLGQTLGFVLNIGVSMSRCCPHGLLVAEFLNSFVNGAAKVQLLKLQAVSQN